MKRIVGFHGRQLQSLMTSARSALGQDWPTTRGAVGSEPDGAIAAAPSAAAAIRREAELLRKLVAMCAHLSALAPQASDLGPVVQVLADNIGSGVVVVDQQLQLLAHARLTDPGELVGELRADRQSVLATVLTAAARNRRALAVPGSRQGRNVVVAPVFVGEQVAGYLLAVHSPDVGFTEDMRLLASEHAAMVCGIVLGRDLVVAAAAGRARQELIEGLLRSREHDEPEVGQWARHLGLDPTREHYVMTLAVPGIRYGAGPSPLELLITRNEPDAIVTGRADEIVAIVPLAPAGPPAAQQARMLARTCLTAQPAVAGIGIGNPSATADELARSYTEARRALAAGRRTGQAGPISVFAELGIHRLLLRVPELSDVRAFADEVLGQLAEEERTTGVKYLATLAAYFRSNGSPARAAGQLHVHPNTVSYRIRRIEELTGLTLSRHRDRLMAEVAVEILAGLEYQQ